VWCSVTLSHCLLLAVVADTPLRASDKDPEVGPEQIQPVFITIDPKRDTPAHIREYVKGASSSTPCRIVRV